MIPNLYHLVHHHNCDESCYQCDLYYVDRIGIKHTHSKSFVLKVDATTVTECLHTFCKSCIVKHLEDNIHCPECDVMIHQSHPLDYIAFDRTMQDIVYKVEFVSLCEILFLFVVCS